MSDTLTIIEKTAKKFKLNILVYGPSPGVDSSCSRTNAIRDKRVQIKDRLISDGHSAHFPEELADPDATPPINPVHFEEILMSAYDFIIVITESPGSLIETGIICSNPKYAAKSHFFISGDYRDGLPFQAVLRAKELGGEYDEFRYPEDIRDCHLLTRIIAKIEEIQLSKFLAE